MFFCFNAKRQILTFQPRSGTTKKLFIFNVNFVFCYFPKCALLQRDRQKTGKNLNVSKLEIHASVQDFLFRAFEHFYIVIWSCMLLKDVLEILPLLMPKTLVDQFVFVWGCEQCIVTMGQLTCLVYYYLKDLDQVHLACRGLFYGHRVQTLHSDDGPNKALQNPKWNDLFLEPFKGHELSKNKVQWLDLPSQLWLALKGLPFAKIVYHHFVVIM